MGEQKVLCYYAVVLRFGVIEVLSGSCKVPGESKDIENLKLKKQLEPGSLQNMGGIYDAIKRLALCRHHVFYISLSLGTFL